MLGAAATSQVFFPDTLPRFVMLLTSFLVWAWLVVFGAINAVALRRSGGSDRVVAVVAPDDGKQLIVDVADGPVERRFTLAAVFTTEGDYLHLAEACRQRGATTLVLGTAPSTHPFVIDAAEELHRDGVRVRSLDDFYDESIGKLPLSALDRFALMGDIESLHGGYAPLKRAIDIVLALLGSLLLLVLIPFVLIGNLFGNRGPLFFRQERVGLQGEPFRIWKLRTMRPGAVDVSGWTANDDPRITPFGKAAATHPHRRVATGAQHLLRRSGGGRSPPRSRSATPGNSRSVCRSTPAGIWCVPDSPVGRRSSTATRRPRRTPTSSSSTTSTTCATNRSPPTCGSSG